MIWVPQPNVKRDQIRHVFNQIKIQTAVQGAIRRRDFSI